MASASTNLYQVDSLAEIQNRLRKLIATDPDNEWIFGTRWFPKNRLGDYPTRADLDAVDGQRPIAIIDIDYHMAWVNTPGLKKLGYNKETPDPVGGEILRDDEGHPTGILFETAFMPIPLSIDHTYESFSNTIAREVEMLTKLGITSISSNTCPTVYVDMCARMAQDDKLNVRVNHWPLLVEGLQSGIKLREKYGGGDRIQVTGLKAFIDGVLSTRTAWMLEPYADAPEEHGYPVIDPEELAQDVIAADAEGFQVIIHAIGDRAIRETLDMYERAAKANGKRDSRHRIEHAELPLLDDQKRFMELGVIPSMTPMHNCAADLDEYIIERIGSAREAICDPWRSFFEQGSPLCFGTDWSAVTLSTPNPLVQIFAAATRRHPDNLAREAWHPEQALTVAQAVQCCTLNPAYADFMEHRKGSITTGKLADLCVLDQNIFNIDPEEILEVKAEMTIFDGQIVFENL
jgi:predicted amidohydrolase YtcJ